MWDSEEESLIEQIDEIKKGLQKSKIIIQESESNS